MSVSWSAHTVIAKIKDFVRENMHLVRSIVVKILLYHLWDRPFTYVFNDFWFVGGLRDALTNIS